MENERANIPPGIGPKLPDPPPVKPMTQPLGKRESIIIGAAALLLVALGAWFILFVLGAARSPVQAVQQQAGEGYELEEPLVQVSLPGEGQRSVLFYVSNGQLACALLQHRAGGYKVLDVSGHLPLSGPGKDGIWQLSSLQGADKEFLVFGLLYDVALTGVTVDGNPAVVVTVGKYRCWYYLGQGSMSVSSESVVYK